MTLGRSSDSKDSPISFQAAAQDFSQPFLPDYGFQVPFQSPGMLLQTFFGQ